MGNCCNKKDFESPEEVARKEEAHKAYVDANGTKVAAKLGVPVDEIVFVLPGTDLSKLDIYEEAVTKGYKNIHLMNGTHIVPKGVTFYEPVIVSGDGREKTIVEGAGFVIKGKIDKNCTFIDLTIRNNMTAGLKGDGGMSFDCRRVKFDTCGVGVIAHGTKGRLTNCQVTNCFYSGIHSVCGGTIEIEGEESSINNNRKGAAAGDPVCKNSYGLKASDSAIIHLLSPLTKEDVSTNNGVVRGHKVNHNYNYSKTPPGTIGTVNSFSE